MPLAGSAEQTALSVLGWLPYARDLPVTREGGWVTRGRMPRARRRLPLGEASGERHHVTVLFCDLVNSTGIAARLDAEEWPDLVGAYLDAASAAVTEMGGKVAKKLGDGLMTLFGYPVAQENDAERVVRAALSIQRALAEMNRKNAGNGKVGACRRIGPNSIAVPVKLLLSRERSRRGGPVVSVSYRQLSVMRL